MSDLEARLTAALHADAPPARDALFRVEVLVRLERARFRRRVARVALVALVFAILVMVNARALHVWIAVDAQRLWIAALTVAAMSWALPGVMLEPGFRTVVRAVGRWLYAQDSPQP